ncbi:MAG: glutathione S-transferase family protein [Rhodospirillaceae bacterium]|nr:glutathione S-transferase family protein [Rhodospirillaceae bacterium]
MAAGGGFRLYGSATSGNAYKPALMLALSREPFEFRPVALQEGESRTDAFRAINRFQEVPVLEHGARRIVQSGVILAYLAETLGTFGHRDDDERWRIQEWLAWDNQRMTGGPALLRYLRRWFPETDPAIITFTTGRAERALGQLDGWLAEHGWLVGNRPTIADIANCAYAFWLDEAGLDPARWPAIGGWLRRIEALRGFARPDALMTPPAR